MGDNEGEHGRLITLGQLHDHAGGLTFLRNEWLVITGRKKLAATVQDKCAEWLAELPSFAKQIP